MKKPTGTTGPVEIITDAEGKVSAEFQPLKFPSQKDEIERMIATDFVQCVGKMPGPGGQILKMSDLAQNTENDLDFTVSTPEGPAYLELMEAAPLTGPFAKAPPQYKPREYAEKVLTRIRAKVHPGNGTHKIYLLVYVTHWAFILSESTINCMRYWLGEQPPPFAGVFLYMPITPTEGIPEWLMPAELPPGFHPDQVAQSVVTNLDPKA